MALMLACTTTTKVKTGQEAYQLKKYALATPLLEKEYEKAKDVQVKSDIAKMIAISYDQQGDFLTAEKWFKKYRENSLEQRAPLVYAKALMKNEKYAEAQEVLEQYLSIHRQDRREVEPLMATCEEVLKDGDTQKELVKIQPLLPTSDYSNFDANIVGEQVIFSSTRWSEGDQKTEWNDQAYASLWFTNSKGRAAQEYEFLKEDFHIASLTLTADGKTAFYTQCGSDQVGGEDYCGIYRVLKDTEGWSEPERISLFGDSVNSGTPYIAADGHTLYFSSDAPYGYGGKDLYLLNFREDGTYGEPLNLGSRVNTPDDEMYPYVTDDGQALYYSSNNNSFGGLDIFKATKVGRLFTHPERLPYGLNTGGDDFALKLFSDPIADTTIAFRGVLTSNRNGTKDYLYTVELTKTVPKELPPAIFIFEGEVVENIYADSLNPSSKVVDQKAIPYPKVVLSGQSVPADEVGFFTKQLDSGFAYQLFVHQDGYLSVDLNFNTVDVKSQPGDTVYFKQKVILSKIIKDVEFVLENIYYDFDKWDIREDARPALDTLSNMLKQNPNIHIELASHTDCRGNDAYNLNLSQMRAESVVQYLISKGIDGERLTPKGYGASLPVESCKCDECTEEEHQRNRRTTFKILNIE